MSQTLLFHLLGFPLFPILSFFLSHASLMLVTYKHPQFNALDMVILLNIPVEIYNACASRRLVSCYYATDVGTIRHWLQASLCEFLRRPDISSCWRSPKINQRLVEGSWSREALTNVSDSSTVRLRKGRPTWLRTSTFVVKPKQQLIGAKDTSTVSNIDFSTSMRPNFTKGSWGSA
jgi:hypothetical protein